MRIISITFAVLYYSAGIDDAKICYLTESSLNYISTVQIVSPVFANLEVPIKSRPTSICKSTKILAKLSASLSNVEK